MPAMIGFALAVIVASTSEEMVGRVVSVNDGDTITVLIDRTQHKIRLTGIDAPEAKQPFGSRAKEHLSGLVAGRDVRIKWRSKDRYGRILGDIYADDRWINREMVESGFAWQYVRFDRSAELRIAEHFARDNAAGLWADREPIPPWEWRRAK